MALAFYKRFNHVGYFCTAERGKLVGYFMLKVARTRDDSVDGTF